MSEDIVSCCGGYGSLAHHNRHSNHGQHGITLALEYSEYSSECLMCVVQFNLHHSLAQWKEEDAYLRDRNTEAHVGSVFMLPRL